MNAAEAMAQLRHAYAQLAAGTVVDQPEFARGLLGPAIERLEHGKDNFEKLSGAVQAEASEHARYIADVAARRQLKGPPKGNDDDPHHWHSLVYRLEERIDERAKDADSLGRIAMAFAESMGLLEQELDLCRKFDAVTVQQRDREIRAVDRLTAQLSASVTLVRDLKECLENLYAVQNGPPFEKDETAWNAAMNQAAALLGYPPRAQSQAFRADSEETCQG